MKINVIGGKMEQKEIDSYVDYLNEKFPTKKIDMDYTFESVPFERIRRITGYLVGTVERFNNAKRAEEHDRVKHSVCC